MHPLEHLWLNHFSKRGNVFSTYAICPWGNIWQLSSEQERPWSQGWSGRHGSHRRLFDRLVLGYFKREGGLIIPEWWHKQNDSKIAEATEDEPYLCQHSPSVLKKIHKLVSARGFKRALNAAYSPLDLLKFDEKSPNDNSISIEFIQWQPEEVLTNRRRDRNYKLTVAQYISGSLLLRDIVQRHSLYHPLGSASTAIIGHEDVDPWGRGKPKTGGWDPGGARPKPRFSWKAMLTGDLIDLNGPSGLRTEIIPTPEVPKWAVMGKVKLV